MVRDGIIKGWDVGDYPYFSVVNGACVGDDDIRDSIRELAGDIVSGRVVATKGEFSDLVRGKVLERKAKKDKKDA